MQSTLPGLGIAGASLAPSSRCSAPPAASALRARAGSARRSTIEPSSSTRRPPSPRPTVFKEPSVRSVPSLIGVQRNVGGDMPMRAVDRVLGLRLLGLHQAVYERSGGLIGSRIGPIKLLLLHTRGRRSGETRTVSLLYERSGDAYVVVGSKGGSDQPPAWLLNLEADPRCEVQVGTRSVAARARIARRDERTRLWRLMTRTWPQYDEYQKRTRRRIPIVVLEPE